MHKMFTLPPLGHKSHKILHDKIYNSIDHLNYFKMTEFSFKLERQKAHERSLNQLN